MEPMALGSPVGSPTGAPSSPTTSPFLPAYLMGDNAPSASTPRSSIQARQQTSKHVTFGTSGLAMPSIHANTPAPIGSSRTLQSVTSPAEKPASDFGPPTLGLFDTLSPLPGAGISSHHHNSTYPSTSALYSPSVFSPNSSLFSPPVGSISIASQGNPLASPSDASPFGSENQKLQDATRTKESRGGGLGNPKEGEQDTWVTVFGFMPNAINDILAHFVHCGTILEHKWGSQAGDGKSSMQRCNWIHLRFRTIREARRAIAKNGKVFGGCMMVGVIPCQDPEILHSQKENIQGPEINFPSKSKNSSCAISGIRPLGVDFISPIKEPAKTRSSSSSSNESTGIRPLMKSNVLPQNEMESGGSLKNNGLISRTIDFLFGQ